MHAAVSKEGITADLEAMKEVGIGGAYLMPIQGVTNPPLYTPVAEQLSPDWWRLVRFAMQEAKRLGLQLAMHASDGFALAGGPWITPELSMQKVVWSTTYTSGNKTFHDTLQQPPTNEHYYKDIAVLAYPSPVSVKLLAPKVTTSQPGLDASFLLNKNSTESFRCDTPCWVQYEFPEPVTVRSVVIRTNGNNYQAQRMKISVSDDNTLFLDVKNLEPPRHGWQDTDADYTYTLPAIMSRYFLFSYTKEGSEPGAEDLDAAKWKPSLKVSGIELSALPKINQYEGKSGAVWRLSRRTNEYAVPDSVCVPVNSIVDITDKLLADGRLNWTVPPGEWTIVRIGHTSTGHTNATGGAGRGLECDKFNPEAVRLQFDTWLGEAIKQAGPDLAKEVLTIFHVDSWECGSQNWSSVFRAEFKKRRGYDLLPYIIAMTGTPVQSAERSEQFLYDIRLTITELVKDNFYHTLTTLAHERGIQLSAESVAPTMMSDGMLHYSEADIPMGEFWWQSPTHDKPNDMLDAISGAHIYGKPIVQAEAFTTLRMAWDEHPGLLKAIQDFNYTQGINRLVYHVFTHNPWMDRKPGMTLDGIGLYFQRDQTWWKMGRAWVEYAQRCQALLQWGKPVVDIAVFTGEELPRRALLPDRLIHTLPGIVGKEVLEREKKRLENVGAPTIKDDNGVTRMLNMTTPADWIDPLHGYAYDSFNPDALRLMKVKDGKVVLPGDASYSLLILPGTHALSPDNKLLSTTSADKLSKLAQDGATIVRTLYTGSSFSQLGIEKDFIATDSSKKPVSGIAWTHRRDRGTDIYFVSNQSKSYREVDLSLRVTGKLPELWDPLTGNIKQTILWGTEGKRTMVRVFLHANGSIFIVLRKKTTPQPFPHIAEYVFAKSDTLHGAWQVQFDPARGGPAAPVTFTALKSWSTDTVPGIRYYSGTAIYTKTFTWQQPIDKDTRVWLNTGNVNNMASVTVNGVDCGIVWTAPYQVDITHALKPGTNELRIEVANTWANRLIGDSLLPEEKRITHTTAPFRLKDKPLLPAGLLGPVVINK